MNQQGFFIFVRLLIFKILLFMKKIIVLSVVSFVLLFSSCTVKKYSISSNLLDYSEFTSNNFFITESNSVSFDYESIGSISVYCESGHYRDPRVTGIVEGPGKWRKAIPKDLLNEAYNKALSKNADGLINMKITYIPQVKNVPFDSYLLTGMLIKRK